MELHKTSQNFTKTEVFEELDDIDRNIIRLKLENTKLRQKDIADIVGLSRESVNHRLNKFEVKRAIKYLQKSAIDILMECQADAARNLKSLMKSAKSEQVKLGACREILKGVLSESYNLNLNDDDNDDKDWRDNLADECTDEYVGRVLQGMVECGAISLTEETEKRIKTTDNKADTSKTH